MANPRLILVKGITLLYRESKVVGATENSADLVRTILDTIRLPEQALSINHERDILMGLKDTALYMCSNPLDHVYDKDDLLQRLKVNCLDDDKLYEAFAQGIEKDMDEGPLKNTILNTRAYINDTFREDESIALVNSCSRELTFNRSKIKNIKEFINNFMIKLEPLQLKSKKKDTAIIATIDIGDTASLNEVYNEIQNTVKGISVLKTGWQDLNKMLQGGFRRGECWVIGALQHKYKTGFSLTIFKQIALYNKPQMIDATKKPLLIRISFEDSLLLNMQFLYQNLWENEFGVTPKLEGIDTKEISKYVQAKLQINGYNIKLLRAVSSDWTYKDVQNYILEKEAEGYEVHCLMLDYLPMLPTTGCEEGPMGHSLRDMYRRMRGFCSAKDITLITPHQLSTDAKMLIREGHMDFVKKINEQGYYAGSKQIDQEVDGELAIHIEHAHGRAYLTVQRGKHRIPTTISEESKYFVLPFPVSGSIPDDVDKPKISQRKIGVSNGDSYSVEEHAWV